MCPSQMENVCADCEVGDPKTIDRKLYLNTRLALQVIAPKLQERRLLHAMAVIDKVLNGGADGAKAKL